MGPLITLVVVVINAGTPLLVVVGAVVGAAVILLAAWLGGKWRRWGDEGAGIRRAGYVLDKTLSATQTVAVAIAALVAVDFFLLTPTLTETVALAQRIDSPTVVSLYHNQVPQVVSQALDQLEGQASVVVPTALTITAAGGPLLNPSQQVVPTSQTAAASSVELLFSNSKLCAGSGASMVDVIAFGACAAPALFQIPFYDRVLLGVNEEAAAGTGPPSARPLDNDQLHQAAGILGKAVRLRATVTLSNNGRSTAQNVAVTPPDQYKALGRPETSITPGQSAQYVFDGPPIGPANQPAPDPTFPFKADPTGPLDPAIVGLTVGVGLCFILVIGIAAIGGDDRGTEPSLPGPNGQEGSTSESTVSEGSTFP